MASLTSLRPRKARDGGLVTLRLAEAADTMPMFRWQLDDRTRRHFRSPAKPTLDEHLIWFHRYLNDPRGRLCVIEHESVPAGVLRLDPLSNERELEVSLLTAPALYRQGVGVPALLLARDWVPHATIHAEVLPGNEASRRMVLAAGYVESSPGHYVSLPIMGASKRLVSAETESATRSRHGVHSPVLISANERRSITESDFFELIRKVSSRADPSWMDRPIEDTTLDSLELMELRSALEARLGRGLSDGPWFEARTLRDLFLGLP